MVSYGRAKYAIIFWHKKNPVLLQPKPDYKTFIYENIKRHKVCNFPT